MLTLILGGARSGKSDLAQRLALTSGAAVTFIATMEPGDDELRAKVAAHRASRPGDWLTVEEPLAVEDAIARAPTGTVVVDCLTLWVTNLLLARIDPEHDVVPDAPALTAEISGRAAALARAALAHDGDVIAVSNEVGLGLVPPYAAGRVFRDALGAVNREMAARADRVYLAVAGLVLDLRALGALPLDAFGEGGGR